MNDRIRELQKEIELENNRIKNCNHEWGDSFYNPEMVKEPYGSQMVTQGSDVWYEPTGYRDVEKPRWSRRCKKCGHEEHTYEQKPIIKGYEPKF